jgi:hypothetical protein
MKIVIISYSEYSLKINYNWIKFKNRTIKNESIRWTNVPNKRDRWILYLFYQTYLTINIKSVVIPVWVGFFHLSDRTSFNSSSHSFKLIKYASVEIRNIYKEREVAKWWELQNYYYSYFILTSVNVYRSNHLNN